MERLDTALDRLGLRTPAARDRALAVLMVLVSSGMLWAFVRLLAEEDGIRLPPTATALLGALVYTQSLALCVRRSRPVLCLAVMALTHLGTVALLPPHVTAQSLAPFIAAYTCGTLLPPRRLLRCITAVVVLLGLSGAAVAGTLPGVLLDPEAAGVARHWTLQEHLLLVGGQLIVALAVYAGPALVGAHVATRRRYTGLVRLRAAEAVERQRERAAGAVMAERARMARELHDIAAHHLSGMVVQAGAAERLIGRDDPAAREATAWIRSQGRETLDSLRLVVGALRDPGRGRPGTGRRTPAPRCPGPPPSTGWSAPSASWGPTSSWSARATPTTCRPSPTSPSTGWPGRRCPTPATTPRAPPCASCSGTARPGSRCGSTTGPGGAAAAARSRTPRAGWG
ncbi:sensor histidine kinase [Nocardiopsis composta]